MDPTAVHVLSHAIEMSANMGSMPDLDEPAISRIGSDLRSIALEKLRPDWKNPRFPPSATDRFQSDADVYAYIDQKFDAVSVAESIARHGFFATEPLIAIVAEGETYIVLEGNRRLTALQALASSSIRALMTDPRWQEITVASDIAITPQMMIPVLIADSREQVAPILGYRHVTGIAPWDPYQQARYVSSLIDDEDVALSAAQVAELIGRDVSEVRAFYRNYSIVEQARDVFAIPDVERIIDEFGVWTRAMTSSGVRDFIDAPPPRDVQEGTYPLPENSKEALEKTVEWLFGAPRSDDDRESGRQSNSGRVINDSRQLTRFGRVLASPEGRVALSEGASLREAERATQQPSTRFIEALSTARNSLAIAQAAANRQLVEENRDLLDDIKSLVESIGSAT